MTAAEPTRTPLPGRRVRGSERGRPLMAALDLLGRRWALRVLWELRDGSLGFRALQAACDGMSSSVLRDRLAELGEAGLLERTPDDAYALTPVGAELGDALAPLTRWSEGWHDALRGSTGAVTPPAPSGSGRPPSRPTRRPSRRRTP